MRTGREEAKSDVVDLEEPKIQVVQLRVKTVSENESKIGHVLEDLKEEVMDETTLPVCESGVKEREGEACAKEEEGVIPALGGDDCKMKGVSA